MSNTIHPSLAPTAEKIKALQYLFDLAQQSPAPAAVHRQANTYAQFLADSFGPAPADQVADKTPSLAEVVAELTKPDTGAAAPTAK
jgi:hypothetical protein